MKQDWPLLSQKLFEEMAAALYDAVKWQEQAGRDRMEHEEHRRDPFNSCHCWRQLLMKCYDIVQGEVGSQRQDGIPPWDPPSLYSWSSFGKTLHPMLVAAMQASQLINSILDWRNLF